MSSAHFGVGWVKCSATQHLNSSLECWVALKRLTQPTGGGKRVEAAGESARVSAVPESSGAQLTNAEETGLAFHAR